MYFSFYVVHRKDKDYMNTVKKTKGVMPKWTLLIAAITILTLSVIGTAIAYSEHELETPETINTSVSVTNLNERMKSLTGDNGTILLVDSISDKEYSEMMNILYPSGIVNKQGQDIAGIDNLEENRNKYIHEHTKAYSLVGEKMSEVELLPFTITIADKTNGIFDVLLYSTSIGNDSFIFPSEWGNQPCGFIPVSEKSTYVIYTDMGIWSINPNEMIAKKLSTDTFLGEDQTEIGHKIKALHTDGYLTWIENVCISPDCSFIVYRTNRDCNVLNESSIWGIDLITGEERQLVSSAYNNDIVGFVSDSQIVVGALNSTQMIDVYSCEAINLTLPELPNFCVKAVNKGVIAYSSYQEGSSDVTMFISSIDKLTGVVADISKVIGYLDGEPRFSPDGNRIAICYGSDPMAGVVDVIIVDVSTKSQVLLTSLIKTNNHEYGNITYFRWVNPNIAVFECQRSNEFSANLVSGLN